MNRVLNNTTVRMKSEVLAAKPKEEKNAAKEEKKQRSGIPTTQANVQKEPDRGPPKLTEVVMTVVMAQKAQGSCTLEMTWTPPKTSKQDFARITNSEACVLLPPEYTKEPFSRNASTMDAHPTDFGLLSSLQVSFMRDLFCVCVFVVICFFVRAVGLVFFFYI